MISDETINAVRERVDIVALVGRYVDLKKAGTLYKGLCPFHSEKTPSFTVSPTRNTYHCFGCGVHGDGIKFLVESQGRTFPEAVRELAGQVGVEVPEERPVSPAQRAARKEKRDRARRLLDVQDKLTAYYTEQLFSSRGRAGQRYLMDRGIDKATAEAFRLGYASGEKMPFQAWVEAHDVRRDDLVALGVLVQPDEGWSTGKRLWGGYLRFRERVMFPVVDMRGEVTGYSGRILDPDKKAAKYVNSPETPVFTKGEQLYGAYTARTAARRAGRVVLVEGNVDVVMLWQAGIEGTVAPMGTAVTDTQARLVKRLAENVVCVMDGDAAGIKAAFASLGPFLEAGVQPRAVMLPEGDDPDSFVRRDGVEAFEALIAAAPPLMDLFIEREAEAHPPDPPGRTAALRAIAPVLAALDDPLAGELYRARVQKRLEMPASLVERAIEEAAAAPRRGARSGSSPKRADKRTETRGETRTAPRMAPAPFDGGAPFAPEPVFAGEPTFSGGPVDFAPPADFGPPPPEAFGGPVFDQFAAPAGAESAEPVRAVAPIQRDSLRVANLWRTRQARDAVDDLEARLFTLLVQFPTFVGELQSRVTELAQNGATLLTRPGLTVFVHNLHQEVDRTPNPNLDRLLSSIHASGDQDTVRFLRRCQARRPDQTRESVAKAFHEALRRCEKACWKRELQRLQDAMRAARKDPARFSSINAEARAVKSRLAEFNHPMAEGAH